MTPRDPDAKITKMKDGRTHLAHKAEHTVDLETARSSASPCETPLQAIRRTMVETLMTAAEPVEAVLPAGSGLAEVVGDKGSHSNATVVALAELGLRSYMSEPDRGRLRWQGKAAARAARVCQPAADTGCPWVAPAPAARRTPRTPARPSLRNGAIAPRRVHLRGHANILKRLLVHVCGFSLDILIRRLTGVGTLRSLQGRAWALIGAFNRFWSFVPRYWTAGSSEPVWLERSARGHQTVFLALQAGGPATGS